MKTEFISFSMKLAGYLMLNGFVLQHMRDEPKSKRKVFIFNDSPELQKVIQDYLVLKRERCLNVNNQRSFN